MSLSKKDLTGGIIDGERVRARQANTEKTITLSFHNRL
jgi:hypothetical protein